MCLFAKWDLSEQRVLVIIIVGICYLLKQKTWYSKRAGGGTMDLPEMQRNLLLGTANTNTIRFLPRESCWVQLRDSFQSGALNLKETNKNFDKTSQIEEGPSLHIVFESPWGEVVRTLAYEQRQTWIQISLKSRSSLWEPGPVILSKPNSPHMDIVKKTWINS